VGLNHRPRPYQRSVVGFTTTYKTAGSAKLHGSLNKTAHFVGWVVGWKKSTDSDAAATGWEWAYTASTMEKLQAFQAAASEGGFVATGESEGGTVLWLRKATVDAEDRICLDSLTNSATVYWATIPWKINSKTFREASELRAWILSRPPVEAQL